MRGIRARHNHRPALEPQPHDAQQSAISGGEGAGQGRHGAPVGPAVCRKGQGWRARAYVHAHHKGSDCSDSGVGRSDNAAVRAQGHAALFSPGHAQGGGKKHWVAIGGSAGGVAVRALRHSARGQAVQRGGERAIQVSHARGGRGARVKSTGDHFFGGHLAGPRVRAGHGAGHGKGRRGALRKDKVARDIDRRGATGSQ